MTVQDVATITEGSVYDFPPMSGCGPHRVFIHVPPGPPPDAGWPLLLATDGNAVFDMAVGMMRTQAADRLGSNVENGVIVAIGYPGADLYDTAGRSWDLSPPPGARYPTDDGPAIRTGGAEHFLTVLDEAILPWLARLVPIDPSRRTLFGHSFGGLFTLYALYRRPRLFGTYVAASPSLYWEDEAIKPFEDAFFGSGIASGHDVLVMLSAGEWEGSSLAPHLRGRPDEAALAARLAAIAKVSRAEALRARFQRVASPSLRSDFEVFRGETHMSALAVALARAVGTAFRSVESLRG